MNRRRLLTVSGTIPADLDAEIEAGRRPRADYRVLADVLGADVVDRAAGDDRRPARLVGRLAGADVALAWRCWRRSARYDVVFTDGEQVAFPYAALSLLRRRRPRHVAIAHLLSARKKVVVHRALGLRRRIDHVIVYSTNQYRFAVDRLGYRPEQVTLTTFMVDTEFWQPRAIAAEPAGRPMICAVGQELRDYPTLVDAVRNLDIDVRIASASPWSKRADSAAGLDVPANVTARGYSLGELRELYASATIVVVPVVETDFQAGITSILEGMAMGKPVICTRTSGQTDTIVDGLTGVYVPPHDAGALQAAIEDLLARPDEAARISAAARAWVVEHADIDVYARRLAGVVADA